MYLHGLRKPLLYLWFCLSAPLALAAEVLIQFDAGSAPTMYEDKAGRARGVYPAIVSAAAKAMGKPVTLAPKPFKRLLADLQAGKAAGGALIRTPERLAIADYSKDYFIERVLVLTRRAAPLAYRQVDDLTGYRVGVIRGWSYGSPFDQARAAGRFMAEDVDADVQNLAKLAMGRLDFVVMTEMAWRALQADTYASAVEAAPLPLTEVGIALAFPRQMGMREWLKTFDEAVSQLKRSRQLEPIVDEAIREAARAHAAEQALSR